MGYDINVAEPAELFGFAKEKLLQGHLDLGPAELLAPAEGAKIGEPPVVIKWSVPVIGSGAPKSWLVETIDQGWPNLLLTKLSGRDRNGETKSSVAVSRTAEIWTIPPDGKIAISARRHWIGQP
jgi:hypothetical protein